MFGRAFPAQSASGTGRVHEGTSRVDDVSPTKQPLLDEVSYLPGLASVRSWWFLSYKSDEALPAPSKGGPGVQNACISAHLVKHASSIVSKQNS